MRLAGPRGERPDPLPRRGLADGPGRLLPGRRERHRPEPVRGPDGQVGPRPAGRRAVRPVVGQRPARRPGHLAHAAAPGRRGDRRGPVRLAHAAHHGLGRLGPVRRGARRHRGQEPRPLARPADQRGLLRLRCAADLLVRPAHAPAVRRPARLVPDRPVHGRRRDDGRLGPGGADPPHDPARPDPFDLADRPPSAASPFGTDWMGRDMLMRTLKGLSISIRIGLSASLVSTLIVLLLGAAPPSAAAGSTGSSCGSSTSCRACPTSSS